MVDDPQEIAGRRGGDILIGTHNYLNLTPLGRQRHVGEALHHDSYGGAGSHCH